MRCPRAFAAPGKAGDPALIEHIATRFVESYEEILDIAANLRGAGVSEIIAPTIEAAARMTDTPLREVRDLIDRLVAETDSIPQRLAAGEPITIELLLTLTIDDQAVEDLQREQQRAREKLLSA